MRELTASGAMIGPRIFASGPGISAPAGAAADPDAMRALVEARVKAGVDWIKVFGSRGGFDVVDGTQTVTLRGDEGDSRCGARPGQESGDSFVRAAGRRRRGARAGPTRSSTAPTSTTTRSARWSRRGTCGCRRSTTTATMSMRSAEYGVPARRRGRAARLHPAQPGVGAQAPWRSACGSPWAPMPCIRCSGRTRASSDGSSRRA